jgi:hypothetical protein
VCRRTSDRCRAGEGDGLQHRPGSRAPSRLAEPDPRAARMNTQPKRLAGCPDASWRLRPVRDERCAARLGCPPGMVGCLAPATKHEKWTTGWSGDPCVAG